MFRESSPSPMRRSCMDGQRFSAARCDSFCRKRTLYIYAAKRNSERVSALPNPGELPELAQIFNSTNSTGSLSNCDLSISGFITFMSASLRGCSFSNLSDQMHGPLPACIGKSLWLCNEAISFFSCKWGVESGVVYSGVGVIGARSSKSRFTLDLAIYTLFLQNYHTMQLRTFGHPCRICA